MVCDKTEIVSKLAFRFEKRDRSRFFSHHDMMRLFARAVRRAELPVRMTAGYNPRPRIVFPHALGLGIASGCEWVEIELYRNLLPQQAVSALSAAVEPVVKIVECEKRPPVKKTRCLRSVLYVVRGWTSAEEDLGGAVEEFMALPQLLVERGIGHKRKEVDARRFVKEMTVQGVSVIMFTLLHLPKGAGRPDEIVRWLAKRLSEERFNLLVEKAALEWDK